MTASPEPLKERIPGLSLVWKELLPMSTSIDIAFICAAPVLHYCGMVNSCDRLPMEASASFTKNIFYFKLMARDALARGEREIAEKYIDIVSCNIFEGKWVRRHRAFLEDTESMRKDKCFENILALMRQHMAYVGDKVRTSDLGYRSYSKLYRAQDCAGCPLRGSALTSAEFATVAVAHNIRKMISVLHPSTKKATNNHLLVAFLGVLGRRIELLLQD